MHKQVIESLPLSWERYKKWHIEKDFQSDVFKKLRAKWWICYHIPDVWMSTKFLDAICVSPEGDIVFLEFKKTDWLTFNFSQFEHSQLILLNDLRRRPNCEVYIPIYSQKTHTYVVRTFSELLDLRNDKWWCKLFN